MLSKVIAGSVVAVACVGGMSVPASADPATVHASSSADSTYVGSATFHVGEGFSESVRLINGRAYRNSVMERVVLDESSNVSPKLIARWKSSAADAHAWAEFHIYRNGLPTDYYLEGVILGWGPYSGNPHAKCFIVKHDSRGNRFEPYKPPFKCETSQYWWDYDWDITLKPSTD